MEERKPAGHREVIRRAIADGSGSRQGIIVDQKDKIHEMYKGIR